MSIKKGPITQMRTTVINRSSMPHSSISFSESARSTIRMSYVSNSFADGVLPRMSQTAVGQVLEIKDKEKQEMQNLNERFASYIERVRYLQAQNKALLLENEKLKKQKGFDVSKIKELYQQELDECKKIIEELSADKATFDARLVGLGDKLEDEKRERLLAEKLNQELQSKLDNLASQLGDYEGEITGLRVRIESLEEENKNLKIALDRIRNDNSRIRADLDEETAKRICAENEKISCIETYQFDINILEAEVEELRALINQDKEVEIRDIWKGELTKAINEIQLEYDRQLNSIRNDMEIRMEYQLKQMQSGVHQENMALGRYKEENKALKSKVDGLSLRLTELEAENARLKAQLQLAIDERDQQKFSFEYEIKILTDRNMELQSQLELVIEELRLLEGVKMSLVGEIDMYRKLLEGETLSMKSILDKQTVIVQEEREKYGWDQHTGKVTIHRTKRGGISFAEASYDGLFVSIENTELESKQLKGWKIVREGGKKETNREYVFGDYDLGPGKTVKVFCTGGQKDMKEGDLCGDFFSWGAGGSVFKLISNDEEEKATLTMKYST